MRLKEFYIGEYKNLRDFTIRIKGKTFLEVLVGENGMGKSNLFEALMQVFRQLYEDNYKVNFSYALTYELNGEYHFVGYDWINEVYHLRGEESTTVDKIRERHLPANVIVYYSGHNDQVQSLLDDYESKFRRYLSLGASDKIPRFIGIGKRYKSLLLAILLLQPKGNKARTFITNKLGVHEVGEQLHIRLRRPCNRKEKGYEVDPFVKNTRFWRTSPITLAFLDRLDAVARYKTELIRDAEYVPGKNKYDDHYELYLSLADFQEAFAGTSSHDLFSQFDNLHVIQMLAAINLEVTLKNGQQLSINQFSDGQFQSIYIYAIVELFRDHDCLTLLDEPDSFLHPKWQYEFLDQVQRISDQEQVRNHVLISSHSAITLIPHRERNVQHFHIKKKKVVCYPKQKAKVIKDLSNQAVSYHESEQMLRVLHEVKLDERPILFTEGSSDVDLIKTAYQKLYDRTPPFHVVHAFNCTYLARLLKDERTYQQIGKQVLFGLFDFDQAYNEWNSVRGESELLESNPNKGLAFKVRQRDAFGIMLPVSEDETVRGQVMDGNNDGLTYKHNSCMTIEHLLYGELSLRSYFTSQAQPGGGQLVVFTGDKTIFSREVSKTLSPEAFLGFKPLFQFIERHT